MSVNDTIARIARIVVGSKQQPQGLYTPTPPRVSVPPPPLTVWHGARERWAPTPNNPLGEFDESRIGTATGVQQGSGAYVSGSRGSGANYQFDQGGDPWIQRALGDRAEAARLFQAHAAKSGLSDRAVQAGLDRIEASRPRLYQAELQHDPGRMMNYDALVREQPEAVRKVLERQVGGGDRTAGEVYQGMRQRYGDTEAARRLTGEGVPHLTYQDPAFRAQGVETAPNYVVLPGETSRLRLTQMYGVPAAATGAAMGALAASDPAKARALQTPPNVGRGSVMGGLAAPAQPLALDEAPTPRGRMPMAMTGMTNRNMLMNPEDPIAQTTGSAAQRYTDYINTAGNLLWGTDPRFVVKPQVPGEWSEYDEENARRTGHELARRAGATALDAMTGGFPKTLLAPRSEQFLGAGGGRIIIPQRQEGVGGMGNVAEMPAPGLISGRYVNDPQRVAFPGVYKDPRVLAEEAAANVAPEHPALKKLFGVTREDLYDIGQQGTRQGNAEPQFWQPEKGRGSYAANAIMTPQNAQRMVDALTEAERYPQLTHGMDAWYVMDPAFQQMVKLVGREQAIKDYTRFNMTTAPFSAGSNVMTELNRGTAANMYAARGDFPTFAKYGGIKEGARGPDFPPELMDVKGHAYHGVQSDPVARFLATGEHGYAPDTVKIPAYSLASGVPETGFQTRWPVADAHIARSSGMADVRRSKDFADYMGGTEYRGFGPWYRENVAAPVGIEAVPAQARQWGLYAPQTGVDTAVGAPKLELLSQSIWERAQRLGIDPYKLRDDVLTGKDHATWLLPGAGLGMGAIAAQDSYQLPPLDVEEQSTGGP